MNTTVIKVAALVFGILLLVTLYLLYTKTGHQLLEDIVNKITQFWNNDSNGRNTNLSSILPSNLEEAKVLVASL